jgi:hypothetical protein
MSTTLVQQRGGLPAISSNIALPAVRADFVEPAVILTAIAREGFFLQTGIRHNYHLPHSQTRTRDGHKSLPRPVHHERRNQLP